MYFLVLFILFLSSCIATSSNSKSFEFYAIVIDAGSTGSRGFVFQIFEEIDNDDENIILSRSLVPTKSKKTQPGLSEFVSKTDDYQAIQEYLLPIFIDAAAKIPIEYHNSTKVFVKGTAGMRLLEESDQKLLWKSLVEALNYHPLNPFILHLEDLGTISGHLEAYYAVLSSNFIAGTIDGNLKAVGNQPLIGALDMGGSSTQLIFYTGDEEELIISPDNFWSHSWLNFGVERVRERVVSYLISEHITNALDGDVDQEVKIVMNPCTFKGYESYPEPNIVVRGTGNSDECIQVLKNVVWPENTCTSEVPHEDANDSIAEKRPCFIDGIEHPRVRGEFYGMSVYFFAIDCIRHLGSKHLHAWPNPTIDELDGAIHEFCGLEWDDLQEMVKDRKHKYTGDVQLPNRCLEALYISLILQDGFGFNNSHRNITLALEVNLEYFLCLHT